MNLAKARDFDAFAMIVDINNFEMIVPGASAFLIAAQFTRDTLVGAISAAEQNGGEVVGLMGDAFLAFFDDASDAATACACIARDNRRVREYIAANADAFDFAPKGPGLKIAIEFGHIESADISTRFLGSNRLFIGEPITYAARIQSAGTGNRCIVGPRAATRWPNRDPSWLRGPFEITGKHRGIKYEWYHYDISDDWDD